MFENIDPFKNSLYNLKRYGLKMFNLSPTLDLILLVCFTAFMQQSQNFALPDLEQLNIAIF